MPLIPALNLSDAKSILFHVEQGLFYMKEAPIDLQNNKELAKELLKSPQFKLSDFSESIRDNEHLVFLSLKNHSSDFEYASERIRANLKVQ